MSGRRSAGLMRCLILVFVLLSEGPGPACSERPCYALDWRLDSLEYHSAWNFDILSALKDGDSFCKTAMSRREDISVTRSRKTRTGVD